MKFDCTCVVCGKQFPSNTSVASCSSACRIQLGLNESERLFFDRVVKLENGCWKWIGLLSCAGLPALETARKKQISAVKYAKQVICGEPRSRGRFERVCDDILCVNPSHYHNDWERLLNQLEPGENGCVNWIGDYDKDGYGMYFIDQKRVRVTRALWEGKVGPIPEGLCCLHTCDRPICCAIEHLFLGTSNENTQDMIRKGRARYTGPTSPAFGEDHHKAVLTEEIVREARQLRVQGMSVDDIAERLDVNKGTIWMAIVLKTWQHIPVVSDYLEKVGLAKKKIRDELSASGAWNGNAKLTADDVVKIRESIAGGASCDVVSEQFKITPGTVSEVCSGRTWVHVGGPVTGASKKEKLTDVQVCEIREFAASGVHSNVELGQIYGVDRTTIHSIVTGKTRKGAAGPKAEAGAKSKLTDEMVIEIRQLLAEGKMRKADIARKFSVNWPTIHNIQTGKTHK